MRQRKLTLLLVTLFVASGLLFAGGEARANFTNFKYNLNSSGSASGTSGQYTWVFAPVPGSSSTQIKNIVFEVPAEIPYTELSSKLTVDYYLNPTSSKVPLTFSVHKPGDGEPETRLGLGDLRYSVVSINPPPTSFSKNGFTLVLNLTGVTLSSTRQLSSAQRQVVQLKSSSATSDSDTAVAPSVEVIPQDAAPTISYFSADQNNLLSGQSLALSWDSSGTGTITWTITASINGSSTSVGSGTGASGTVGPLTPSVGTTVYTLTVSNSGGPSTQQETVTVSALPGAPAVTLTADPNQLTSGQQPLCSKLSWVADAGSTVTIANGTGTIGSGLSATGSMMVCPESTTTYTATATNAGGSAQSAPATVTVNAPVIQTSCMQILKKPVGGNPTCLHVCFEIGGEKNLVSADLYTSGECGVGEGIPLAIFGPDVPNPAYRVSALHCGPCGIAGPEQSPACNGIPYGTGSGQSTTPPFDINVGAYTVKCDNIVKQYEPSGVTVDLGADPYFWNGSRWVQY